MKNILHIKRGPILSKIIRFLLNARRDNVIWLRKLDLARVLLLYRVDKNRRKESEMKAPIRIIAVAAALALAVAPFAAAHMMNGNQGNASPENVEPAAQPGMMGNGMMGMGMMGMMSHMNAMVGNMSRYYTTMSTDFDKLDGHLDKMMQIDDITTLKAELKKHQDMTRELRQEMTGQNNPCPMMSMAGTGNSNSMMGMNDPNSASTGQDNSSSPDK
jgi:hypothetical protein